VVVALGRAEKLVWLPTRRGDVDDAEAAGEMWGQTSLPGPAAHPARSRLGKLDVVFRV